MNAKGRKKESTPVCRVIHSDDHALFRVGLRKIIEERDDMQLVASVDGTDLKEALKGKPCDVLLLDLSMPDADGLELMEYVKKEHANVRVIALTMHKNRDYFRAAMVRGVHGYVLKDDVFETLIHAIRTVFAGEKFYSAEINKMIVEEYEMRQDKNDSLHLLTAKEQEVLKMIARGMMNKEIAKELFLSVRTVESTRARIMHKLKIPNVQGLVKFAVDRALI